MPTNISKARLRKAFNEGRRSANVATAENPYDNLKLRKLWEQGRTQQRDGVLTSPIPPLERGETRAQRVPQNPPGSKRAAMPPPRPRQAPRYGDRNRGGGGGSSGPPRGRGYGGGYGPR